MKKKTVYLTNYTEFTEKLTQNDNDPLDILEQLQQEVNESGNSAGHLIPCSPNSEACFIFNYSHETEIGIYYTYTGAVS